MQVREHSGHDIAYLVVDVPDQSEVQPHPLLAEVHDKVVAFRVFPHRFDVHGRERNRQAGQCRIRGRFCIEQVELEFSNERLGIRSKVEFESN